MLISSLAFNGKDGAGLAVVSGRELRAISPTRLPTFGPGRRSPLRARLIVLNTSIRRPTTAPSPLAMASRAVCDVGAAQRRRHAQPGPRHSVPALDLLLPALHPFTPQRRPTTSPPQL